MRLYIIIISVLLSLSSNVLAQREDNNESARNAALAMSDSLFNIANYMRKDGKYEEAIKFATQALNIRERIYATEDSVYVDYLFSLAEDNSNLGNYSEAIRLESKALSFTEKAYHGEMRLLITEFACWHLANYNLHLGNYEEAIRYRIEALNIIEKTSGRNNTRYAFYLSTLAEDNSKLGNYTEAIRLSTEALNIYKDIYGEERSSCIALAYYNSCLGNYGEAIRFWKTGKKTSNEHIDDAIYLIELAETCSTYFGNFTVAAKLCTEAQNIIEKTYEKNHPYYVLALTNHADYNSKLGNYTEAITQCTEAQNIIEKTCWLN